MTGSLHVELLLGQSEHRCRSPLYIIVSDEQFILQKVSTAEMFHKARWILLKRKQQWFESLNIPFDCEFLVMKEKQLEEVYRISRESPLIYAKFGDLEPGTWPPVELYKRRHNMQGYVMKTAVLDDVCMSEFHESVDGGTGSEFNGSWDGMVGMIVRGEVMVGASSFLMTTQRMDVVDYTQSLAEAGNYVYIRKPDKCLLPWTSSLAPFSARLWFCVIATILMLTIFMGTMTFFTSNYGVNEDKEFCFRNAWLYVIGIFCQQGNVTTPKSLAGRIVYITSYVCALVLLAGYGGNYISFLTAGRPLAMPFTSFREMLKDGTYIMGAIHKSAQLDIFRKTTDPLFKEIYKKLMEPDAHNFSFTYFEAINRVCHTKYGFVSASVHINRFGMNSSCEITKVPKTSIPGMTAIATKKKFPFLGLINYSVNRMREAALLKIIQERTLKISKYHEKEDWDTVSLEEVIPIFSVFLLGIMASLFVLIVECFTSWVVQRKTSKPPTTKENRFLTKLYLSKYDSSGLL